MSDNETPFPWTFNKGLGDVRDDNGGLVATCRGITAKERDRRGKLICDAVNRAELGQKWQEAWKLLIMAVRDISAEDMQAVVDLANAKVEAGHREALRPLFEVVHGVSCKKFPHAGTGYLHDEDDDTEYVVDGVMYCGRCHTAIERKPR